MKLLTLILTLAAATAAQTTWLPLTTSPGRDGFIYAYRAGSMKEDGDRREFWMRVTPKATNAKYRRTRAAYSLLYVSVDCERKRWTTDSSIAFDRRGQVIQTVRYASADTPIVPDSVGEEIWLRFCFSNP